MRKIIFILALLSSGCFNNNGLTNDSCVKTNIQIISVDSVGLKNWNAYNFKNSSTNEIGILLFQKMKNEKSNIRHFETGANYMVCLKKEYFFASELEEPAIKLNDGYDVVIQEESYEFIFPNNIEVFTLDRRNIPKGKLKRK